MASAVGGSAALLSHFGAQILHAQVSPGWRRRRHQRCLALLQQLCCALRSGGNAIVWPLLSVVLLRCFCTSVLKSCMRRCRLVGDGGV